jgi:hypothetical protein
VTVGVDLVGQDTGRDRTDSDRSAKSGRASDRDSDGTIDKANRTGKTDKRQDRIDQKGNDDQTGHDRRGQDRIDQTGQDISDWTGYIRLDRKIRLDRMNQTGHEISDWT